MGIWLRSLCRTMFERNGASCKFFFFFWFLLCMMIFMMFRVFSGGRAGGGEFDGVQHSVTPNSSNIYLSISYGD